MPCAEDYELRQGGRVQEAGGRPQPVPGQAEEALILLVGDEPGAPGDGAVAGLGRAVHCWSSYTVQQRTLPGWTAN